MKYFFILGSNPTLSTAEISAVFGLGVKETKFPIGNLVSENVLIMETDEGVDARKIIKKLGGTVKIGIINYKLRIRNEKELRNKLIKLIDTNKIKGKFKFGISCYGKSKFNIKPLAMEIKKYLRENGISSRWVMSREPVLSSVVVEQNGLVDDGMEIILFNPPYPPLQGGQQSIFIGQTLAVQPFKELSFRDYGRPARDDYSGMLPPKLAQIMINLAIAPLIRGDGGIILDPFCGSGTILTEVILMGYKNIIGADISKKAVNDTQKNIEWIIKNYELRITNCELFNRSVLELSKFIKPNSINAIVTEPYLGPPRGKVDLKKIKRELENLYSKSLVEFKKILKPNGRIVMVWPVFLTTHSSQLTAQNFIMPRLNGFKIINPIPESLRKNKIIKLTNRNTIIYGREGQKIWREIIILKKAILF